MDWLATGEGPRQRGAGPPGLAESQAPVADGGDFVAVDRYDVRLSAGAGAVSGRIKVTGKLMFSREFLRRHLGRASTDGLAIVEVTGDSMEPVLREGDIVMIDTADRVLTDALFAVVAEDALYVKRLRRIPGGVEVRSDNPAYPPSTWTGDLADQVQIIGRVRWIARAL